MSTDYRALCVELNHWVVELAASHPNLSDSAITWINEVADRARAELAKPEPVELTDQEVADAFAQGCRDGAINSGQPAFLRGARAAIAADRARWGTPANTINQED